MEPGSGSRASARPGWPARAPRIAAALGALIGAVALVGWATGVAGLKSVAPGLATMKVVTALVLIAGAAGLWLESAPGPRARARGAARALGVAVAAVGLWSLAEYGLARGLDVRRLLFHEEAQTGADALLRMSPQSAAAFVPLGVALALGRGGSPARQVRLWAAAASSLVALVALAGQLYSVTGLFGVSALNGMAVHTAAAILALGGGLVVGAPPARLPELLNASGPAALVGRRLLPAAIVVPLVLAAVLARAEERWHFGLALEAALLVVVITAALVALIAWSTLSLQRLDTAREEAARALAASEERWRSVVSSAGDALILADEAGRILSWNAAAERVFGRAEVQVLGEPLTLIIPERLRAAHTGALERLSGGGAPRLLGRPLPLDGLHADGHEFPVELTLSSWRGDGRVFYSGIIRDVSERREVERLKDEFISVVSHELRTPLTSIRGSLGLLAAGVVTPQSSDGEEMLRIAAANAERLVRLINDVLDMERVSSGTAPLTRRERALAALVEQAIGEMGGLAEERGVRLVSEVAPLRLYVDPDRIVQALVNLLSNAIKFSPPGGVVRVLGERRGETEALVGVRDEGRGIPADKLDSIFERFSQVDGSDAREQGGSGLGLAICRSIVAHHGGEIWAESAPGRGTTLWLTLPLAERASAPARAALPAGGPAVLVCDDDPEVCDHVAALIERHGYRALRALSGPQALALVARERPAAILLDLIMPGMDGWETLAALLARPQSSTVPVVILSVLSPERAGVGDPGATSEAVVEWLTKPVDEERLIAALGRAAAAGSRASVLVVDDDRDVASVELVERIIEVLEHPRERGALP